MLISETPSHPGAMLKTIMVALRPTSMEHFLFSDVSLWYKPNDLYATEQLIEKYIRISLSFNIFIIYISQKESLLVKLQKDQSIQKNEPKTNQSIQKDQKAKPTTIPPPQVPWASHLRGCISEARWFQQASTVFFLAVLSAYETYKSLKVCFSYELVASKENFTFLWNTCVCKRWIFFGGGDWKIWIFAAGRVTSEKAAKGDPSYRWLGWTVTVGVCRAWVGPKGGLFCWFSMADVPKISKHFWWWGLHWLFLCCFEST